MEHPPLCTLDQLTELVENALAVDYPGAPTGRVRDIPDRRVIRWYVTRGLVDRPVATRGRVALYGRRHLLQLVAIKRRQADGRSLAEIQAELAGATDDVLAGVARLPDWPVGPADGATGPARARFWADRPTANATGAASSGTSPTGTAGDGVAFQGIRLAPGVILLVESGMAPAAGPDELLVAARPLLDLLAAGRQALDPGPAPGDPMRSEP